MRKPVGITAPYREAGYKEKKEWEIQRPWVGLTVEERNDCLVEADPCECLAKPEAEQLMIEIEAKLKEKNCA